MKRATLKLSINFALILLVICASLAFSRNLATAYYAQGLVLNDGAIHNISSGNFSAGIAQSNDVNYLEGIELDNGTLNFSGGSVTGGSAANSRAANYLEGLYTLGGTANIYGGTITGGNTVNDSFTDYHEAIYAVGGTINIYGGTITGGSDSGLSANNYFFAVEAVAGVVNIFGGSFSTGLNNSVAEYYTGLEGDGGTVNIRGTGFNFPYGPISAGSGTLTGTLSDGTPLNLSFYQVRPGEIALVPEPGVAALATLTLVTAAGGIRRMASRAGTVQKSWLHFSEYSEK